MCFCSNSNEPLAAYCHLVYSIINALIKDPDSTVSVTLWQFVRSRKMHCLCARPTLSHFQGLKPIDWRIQCGSEMPINGFKNCEMFGRVFAFHVRCRGCLLYTQFQSVGLKSCIAKVDLQNIKMRRKKSGILAFHFNAYVKRREI